MERFKGFDISKARSNVMAVLKYEDSFYDSGLRLYNFNEAFHLYLKSNGYRTIIFFSSGNGFFSYEQRMLADFCDDKTTDNLNDEGMFPQTDEDDLVGDLTGLSTLQFNEGGLEPLGSFNRHLINRGKIWQEQTIGKQDSQIADIEHALQSVENCVIVVEPSVNEFSLPNMQRLETIFRHGNIKKRNRLIVLVDRDLHFDSIPESMIKSNSVFLSYPFFRNHFISEYKDKDFNGYRLKEMRCRILPAPTKKDIQNAFQYWRIIKGDEWRIEWKDMDTILDQLSISRGEEDKNKTQTLDKWEDYFEELEDVSIDTLKTFGVRKVDDYRKQLTEMIGMNDFKELLISFENQIKDNDFSLKNSHIFLTGNPGTGKTTIAQILGGCLHELGILSKAIPVEVNGTELKSDHYGGAATIVNEKVDEAIGGVLFIDEAYSMTHEDAGHGKDPLGREAIDTLVKRLDKDRDKFIAIVAGYRKPMEEWLAKNPGLKRRFPIPINIDDYNAKELQEIFLQMLIKENKFIDDKGMLAMSNLMVYVEHHKQDDFGNAGWVRNIVDKLITIRRNRVLDLKGLSEKGKNTIVYEDFKHLSPKDTYDWHPSISSEQEENDSLKKLNNLIGLNTVKEEIGRIKASMEFNKRYPNRPRRKISKHYCFTGNPGTGKTTVAQLFGEILAEYGVCEKNKIVICDREKLVAGFQGQTAIKVNEVVDSALGGVLFIDEIYSLVQGPFDEVGNEATNTLIQRLENDRANFVAIIAGYENKTKEFLKSNPGLQSRFTKYVKFEDYKPDELHRILEKLLAEDGCVIDSDGDKMVFDFITESYYNRDENFGNARWVRTLSEKLLEYNMERAVNDNLPDEMASIITMDDVEKAIAEMKKANELIS